MDKSKIMPIGSPLLFRLNLAMPDSSIPLIMRLLSVTSRLTCLESCREESMNGISEHTNVIKLPRKNDDILFIFGSPLFEFYT